MARPLGCNDLTKKDLKKQATILAKDEKTDDDIVDLEFFRQKRDKFLHPPLSETAKAYLIERYSSEKYNIRRASAGGLLKGTITKGIALEKEGVDLISFLDKIKYQKPDAPVSNDYLIGECDIFCDDSTKLVEVKTSWNAGNFMKNRRVNKLTFQQWCQIQGYMELYDIDFGQVCHVLVNTPPHLIDQEKTNLFKRYTFGELTRDEYEDNLEKYDSIFDYSKIPISKRVIRFDVPRFKEFMPLVYDKIDKCRVWLNEFERAFLSNKIIVTSPEDYINAVNPEEDNTEHNPPESHS
jgi:hypothetical protein